MNKFFQFFNDHYKSGIRYALLFAAAWCFLVIVNNDEDYKNIFLPCAIIGGACVIGYAILQKNENNLK